MPEILSDSAETTSLLEQAAAGNERAFELLMQRHLSVVTQSVRRRLRRQLQPRIDLSDIVQETQHRVFSRLNDFLERRPMPFRLWLLRTAHHRIVDAERMHLQAAKRSVDREIPLPDRSSIQMATRMFTSAPSPQSEASRRELARMVRSCMAQLPDLDREVLMLRCFDGLSNQDVATLLELNPETTKKRFTRALIRLQQSLRAAGISEV